MADHSVGARDELHESEASEASVFSFDNASSVDGLVCFIHLCLRVYSLRLSEFHASTISP